MLFTRMRMDLDKGRDSSVEERPLPDPEVPGSIPTLGAVSRSLTGRLVLVSLTQESDSRVVLN